MDYYTCSMAEQMVSATCKYCGSSFSRRLAEARRDPPKYCSKKCMGQDRFDEAGFWSRLMHRDGCMVWSGSKNRHGYGTVRYKGRCLLVHQLSWILKNGPIPEGMCVCHSCDNPTCGKPDHLWLGTHKENMDDMTRKGRRSRKVTDAMKSIISSSSLPTCDLAYALGVSERTVRNYRPAPPDNTDKG